MKTTIILILLLISTGYTQWNSIYTPTPEGDLPFAVAKGNSNTVDINGNCYVTGFVNEFSWSAKDIVTIKYDLSGDTAWVRTYNGSANADDEGTAVTTDALGNVYVTGYASVTFKYYDVILLKYSSDGSLLWAKTYGITGSYREDRALSISLDEFCNIYITGYGTGSDGGKDIIISKYDKDGYRKWTRLEDGAYNYNAEGHGIVVDRSGNICITGFVQTQYNGDDIIVNKYNSSGLLIWSTTYNNNNYNEEDKAWGIVVDETDNIYISGHTTINSSMQNTDALTLKLNSSGTLLWEAVYNGTGNEEDRAWGIVVDTDGSIFIGGYTTAADFNQNYLTVKYDSEGSQQWVAEYNGTGNGEDYANAIGIVVNNGIKSIVVTGASWGTEYNHDYATVKYDITTGEQTNASRFSMTGYSDDIATDLAILDNVVCITGYSELIFENSSGNSSIVTQNLNWGTSSELSSLVNIPVNFSLNQNYPNPFNPTTTIDFSLPNSALVKMVIYDILGKQVDVLINQNLSSGSHKITFNAAKLSSGIYFYELTTSDGFRSVKKMNLIK